VSEDREWYVLARDAPEADRHVEVFGPFKNESDARAYALDLANDDDEDGWEAIEPLEMSHESAEDLSTDGRVMWPYEDRPPD
jgi:hypothetical protein